MQFGEQINRIKENNDKPICDPLLQPYEDLFETFETIESDNSNPDPGAVQDIMAITVVGQEEIKLTLEERMILNLPPKFMINDRLSTEEFEVELAMMATKYRWELRKEIDEDLGNEEPKISEGEKADLDRIEALGRAVANHHAKTFDLGNKRATDIPGLNSIKLPGPLPIRHESELSLRQETFRNVLNDYMDECCLLNGDQESNLNSKQKKGLKSLKSRIKKESY